LTQVSCTSARHPAGVHWGRYAGGSSLTFFQRRDYRQRTHKHAWFVKG